MNYINRDLKNVELKDYKDPKLPAVIMFILILLIGFSFYIFLAY